MDDNNNSKVYDFLIGVLSKVVTAIIIMIIGLYIYKHDAVFKKNARYEIEMMYVHAEVLKGIFHEYNMKYYPFSVLYENYSIDRSLNCDHSVSKRLLPVADLIFNLESYVDALSGVDESREKCFRAVQTVIGQFASAATSDVEEIRGAVKCDKPVRCEVVDRAAKHLKEFNEKFIKKGYELLKCGVEEY